MKILTIVGARPQFIKAATVSRVLAELDGVHEVIVHTGQHYDANMSEIFFEELAIPKPDYNLGIGGSNHGAMTGRQLEAIECVLLNEKPEWVLVYGDTNSTLASALAAVKLHIPIAHVESGLRSFNRKMPEEINRILTDHAADLLFAPTETSVKNLRFEGIDVNKIHLVGDVMLDASLFYNKRARQPQWFCNIGLNGNDFVLATVHRAENTDDPTRLQAIMDGLGAGYMPVVMPLHPRTRKSIYNFNIKVPPTIHLVDPVGYLEMIWLEDNCCLIATDSGGVQKEAYFFGKQCVTFREETEWIELVESGWNCLVGADNNQITTAISGVSKLETSNSLYGTGEAAHNIIKILLHQ